MEVTQLLLENKKLAWCPEKGLETWLGVKEPHIHSSWSCHLVILTLIKGQPPLTSSLTI